MPLLALVLAGAPLAARAQQDETPAPTPAPAPSTGRTIDFRLPQQNDGRASGVQGPADNGLPPLAPGEQRGIPTPAPTPAPPPVAPRIVPTQPTPSPTPAPTPAPERRTTPTPAPVRGAAQAPTAATPETSPAAPKPVQTPTDVDAPANDAQTAPPPVDVAPAAGAPDRGGTPLWAWALALLAAAGAGFWYWRRRPALAGDAPDEPVGAPPRAPVRAAAPRAVTPPPPPARAPQPAAAAPRSASPLVTRPAAERRAQIAMALGVRAIRVTAEHVAVGFTIELRNDGPLAATGLMVRIALGQGSAMQEAVIARFFDGAGGSVLRDGMDIAPGATETLNSEASLPRGSIEPLMIGGKPALVPVLVLDVTYHWDGDADAFGQTAGAYVLGRAPAAGAGDRLAPLPLDRPVYSLDRPAARATAARRTQ
ncbi:hypothetical protein [Sphingopyxis indica]|uniref:LPXTG-motif cell wall anchor domain-containing protein n=1 Tax=Sphingopyxis indica TaxID=436663 RepID=A0A239K1N9_9SPHN|nr:hypothetical protein [Sphingopyxis indica]SNT11955.1 hypothetical protein SAMN06295955_11243 [Sphingopyxis indica]